MSNTSEEILSLLINFEYLLKGAGADKFDIKLKVLHLIDRNENATPNLLIDKLGMARSNLAIMCNKLVKNSLIEKHKESLNKKEIFYTITQEGKDLLTASYAKADQNFAKLRNKNKISKLAQDLSKLI